MSLSCGVQDAGTEQVEARSAVHGSLDGLDAVDLTFDGAGGPRQVKGRLHGILVAVEACGKTRQKGVASDASATAVAARRMALP